MVDLEHGYKKLRNRKDRLKRILVTGSKGFLAHHLIQELEKVSNILQYDGDIRDFSFNEPVDEIYNLAGTPSPAKYSLNPIRTLETNTIGMNKILQYAAWYNAKLLQASTGEVYEKGDHTEIRACYRYGKMIAEIFCFDYARMFNFKAKILRMYNSYGPYMSLDDGRVIPVFILKALRNEDIIIFGGRQTRSFCYASDMIDGMIKMMESNINIPVNICSPEEFSVSELAEIIIQKSKSSSRIIHKPKLKEDQNQINPTENLAQDLLQWEPKVSFEDGISITIDYFRKRLNVGKKN